MDQDKRNELRIPIEKLPDILRTIVFSTGAFNEYSGTTINASLNGISINVDKSENLKNKIDAGDSINIILYPEKLKLKAKIIYIKESASGLSLGIQLLKTSKELYQDLVNNI
jgi:hypothetical protein